MIRCPKARFIILPVRELYEQEVQDVGYITSRGVDIRLLTELTLMARNLSESHSSKMSDIPHSIVDIISEEVELLVTETVGQEYDDQDITILITKMVGLCLKILFHVEYILGRTVGNLNELEMDMVLEEWLTDDVVFSFRIR